jgi:uncharacterized protein with HEPN domain
LKESARRDRFLVGEMLRHADVLVSIAKRGKATLEGDTTLRYAAEHATELIAEAAGKVSSAYKGATPGIPWDSLRPLRRLVAHPYDIDSKPVEVDQLWKFATKDVPSIAKRLRRSVPKARTADSE